MIPVSNTTKAYAQDFVAVDDLPLPILEAYAQGTQLITRYSKCLNFLALCVVV
jgi:hypothetical protein